MEIGLKTYYEIAKYKQVKNATWNTHYGNLVTKETEGTSGNDIKDEDLKPARVIKNKVNIIPSIVTQRLNFLTYVVLLVVYLMGDDQSYLTSY